MAEAPPEATPEQMNCLDDCFPHGKEIQQFSDSDRKEVSRLLLAAALPGPSFGRVPRLYIILRLIDQLSVLEKHIDLGANDLWLPFSVQTLPKVLSPSYQKHFLNTQAKVITKGLHLENPDKRHVSFTKGEELPLRELNLLVALGYGGYTTVDRVQSIVSGRHLARKRFKRRQLQNRDLKSFVRELEVLKDLHHYH